MISQYIVGILIAHPRLDQMIQMIQMMQKDVFDSNRFTSMRSRRH